MLDAPYGRVGGCSGENDRQSKAAKPAADISAGTTWRETVEVSENLASQELKKLFYALRLIAGQPFDRSRERPASAAQVD
jgi:hypothetical protein